MGKHLGWGSASPYFFVYPPRANDLRVFVEKNLFFSKYLQHLCRSNHPRINRKMFQITGDKE